MDTTYRIARGYGLGILALSLIASSFVVRADVQDDKDAIRDNYSAYVKAFKARDAEAIFEMETSDYTERTTKGQVASKQQADDAVRQVLYFTRSVPKADVKIQSLTVKGSQATAVILGSTRLVLVDPAGKSHTLTIESKVRDSWVKSSSGWRVRFSQELSSVGTMDGRKIPTR